VHTEDPDAGDSTTLASSPAQDQPRFPAARARSTRFLRDQDGGTTSAASRTERGRRGSLRWGFSRVAVTMLYAVLAGLLGVLGDVLEGPPAGVTAIIVASFFGALMANDVNLRGRTDR
jgi:hypothetical protein